MNIEILRFASSSCKLELQQFSLGSSSRWSSSYLGDGSWGSLPHLFSKPRTFPPSELHKHTVTFPRPPAAFWNKNEEQAGSVHSETPIFLEWSINYKWRSGTSTREKAVWQRNQGEAMQIDEQPSYKSPLSST